jgi:hypothetical protein
MAVTTSGKDKLLTWTRIIYGGYDLSGDARTIGSLENMFGEADFTGLNERLSHFTPDYVRQVGVSGVQVLMNDTAASGATTLLQNPSSSNRLSILMGGGGEPAIADPAYLLPSIQMNTTTSFDGPVGVMQADFMMDEAQYDANTSNPIGVILCNQALTVTVDLASHKLEGGSTTTTNGWHANLHITATASGDYAFVIEHSTNDADWATLGTFTADGSAITSEHLSDSDNPVNQYVRMGITRTAGTCTAIVTFARN